jgi:hypothetical protein
MIFLKVRKFGGMSGEGFLEPAAVFYGIGGCVALLCVRFSSIKQYGARHSAIKNHRNARFQIE